MDKEKVEATIMGIDASVSAWLNQERSKQNMYLRRKGTDSSNRIDQKGKAHYKWLRKPGNGLPPKAGEPVYFYDKIANADLVIALVPVFLVFVFLLNLIA